MRRILLPSVLIALLALSGCATGYSGVGQSGGDVPAAPAEDSGGDSDGEAGGDEVGDDGVERQVVISGSMTITVDEPTEAAADAVSIVERIGGRVDARAEYAPTGRDRGSASLVLRIPAASLTATIERLKELGSTEELALGEDDVTSSVRDLDARIEALQASVDRLVELLATADDTDVLLQIESTLTERQADLESLQTQRRQLSDRVDLATVELELQSREVAEPEEPVTFVDGLGAGWDSLVAFVSGALVVLGVLLPWLVVLAAIGFAILFAVRRARRARTAQPASAPAGGAPES